MRTHIKVVALVNLLLSGLGLLKAIGFLFGGVLSSVFSGSIIGMVVGTVASTVFAVIFGALSLFGIIASLGLLNNQQWSRMTIIAISILRLINWPFGSIFGAYSLWVLLNSESKTIFDTQIG